MSVERVLAQLVSTDFRLFNVMQDDDSRPTHPVLGLVSKRSYASEARDDAFRLAVRAVLATIENPQG